MFSWSGSACCGSSWPGSGSWSRLFLSIEATLPEERVAVQRPRGGPLDPLGRVLLREPQHAEARLEALLRVRLRGHDRLEQRGGLRPRLPRPVRQPPGCQLDLVEMGARHV